MESFETKKSVDHQLEQWKRIANNPEAYERAQNPEEIEMIRDADKESSQVIESYSLSSISLPTDLVHIIKAEHWPDGHAFFFA